jgi:hypothetical protein
MSEKKLPHYDMFIPMETISMDMGAFDALMRSNGVLMQHFRAIRCPIGVTDRHDIRSHTEHSVCSNGYIYRHAGDVTVFFSSNSTISKLDAIGVVDGSSVQVTLPRTYDDGGEELAVQVNDRFFLKELATTSVNTQLIEASITGVDRLQYKAVSVEHLIDSHGTEYALGDYEIQGGNVVWSKKRPPFDPETSRGCTYSIRYRYTPYWYVDRLIHEVRVARVTNWDTQSLELERAPHAAMLRREFLFENEERVSTTQGDARDTKSPRTGSFGPR